MGFSSWGEFLQMGGHGLYVWTAYAIGMALLLGNALWPLVARRRFLRQYESDRARRARRAQSALKANEVTKSAVQESSLKASAVKENP